MEHRSTDAITRSDTIEACETTRLSRVLKEIVYICFIGCALTLGMGISLGSTWAIAISAAGIAYFFVPLLMIDAGRPQPAALLVALGAQTIVTTNAVTGAGLHDISMAAFPLIMSFAGMTLRSRAFRTLFVMLLASLGFIAANSSYGWIPARAASTPAWAVLFVLAMISTLSAMSAAALARSHRSALARAFDEIERRKLMETELAELSQRDSLTGVFSRRAYDAELEHLAHGQHYPVSVIIVDVDELKFINDTRGHSAGDALIIGAANVLSSIVRSDDMLARIGGDEFALLLPDTDGDAARLIYDRIHSALASHNHGTPEPALALSCGVATAQSPAELGVALLTADAAMYDEKWSRRTAVS